MPETPEVTLVQDALPFLGGAERVLQTVLELYPSAPISTLVCNRDRLRGSFLEEHEINTSFIDRLPGARKHHRTYLPLFPLAIEQFDLNNYALILSFSYAVAHGVLTRPDQVHISYMYTPMRQAWHYYHQFLRQKGYRAGPRRWLAQIILHYIRIWDQAAAARVDRFVASSKWGASLIWRAYRRDAEVIYPPVDLSRFHPLHPREDYYLMVSRMVPHKKVSLVVEAFNQLDYPLMVVGQGEQIDEIKEQAAENVQVLGQQPDHIVAELMGRAKALVHIAEEDFGLALVEAQAAGCPVIAFGKGGACETVVHGETGLFYPQQNSNSLRHALKAFEDNRSQFQEHNIRRNAERFSKARFKRRFAKLVEREYQGLQGQR